MRLNLLQNHSKVWVKVWVWLLWCVKGDAAKLGVPVEAREQHLETLEHANSLEMRGSLLRCLVLNLLL